MNKNFQLFVTSAVFFGSSTPWGRAWGGDVCCFITSSPPDPGCGRVPGVSFCSEALWSSRDAKMCLWNEAGLQDVAPSVSKPKSSASAAPAGSALGLGLFFPFFSPHLWAQMYLWGSVEVGCSNGLKPNRWAPRACRAFPIPSRFSELLKKFGEAWGFILVFFYFTLLFLLFWLYCFYFVILHYYFVVLHYYFVILFHYFIILKLNQDLLVEITTPPSFCLGPPSHLCPHLDAIPAVWWPGGRGMLPALPVPPSYSPCFYFTADNRRQITDSISCGLEQRCGEIAPIRLLA